MVLALLMIEAKVGQHRLNRRVKPTRFNNCIMNERGENNPIALVR